MSLTERLTAGGVSVAVAESAAGGLIAAELSRLPGSSAYFRGGVVAYDDASKTQLLGIPAEVLVRHGSVSSEACQALAEAARRVFGASFGIGETSIAGPGGATEAKPVGLCYVAVASEKGTEVRELRLQADRDSNRRTIVAAAVDLLADTLGSLA